MHGTEDLPVVLQHSKFAMIGESGSTHNGTLLEAIIECKQAQALISPIITYIVHMQFNAVRHWVIVYTVLLSFDIIILMLLVGLRFKIYLVISFGLVNILLIARK